MAWQAAISARCVGCQSGRYQARYRGPDGRLRSAPYTFARKAEAVRWLALKEAEISRGDWIDPEHAGVLFGNYAEQWLQKIACLRCGRLTSIAVFCSTTCCQPSVMFG